MYRYNPAVNALRRFGDTAGVLRGGARLGVYYCEKGASQRPVRLFMTGLAHQLLLQSLRSLSRRKFSPVRIEHDFNLMTVVEVQNLA